jgi:class 3 adenylate cyclase/tetratricopeptide (TPR) repeat protein
MLSCPQCRVALPANARFCAQCGARLAVSQGPVAGERRPVAILFADLAGFTRLTSELDAEDVHRLLGRFFEVVDAAVVRLGGTIDKHIGDATMAVFGAPIAHGNDVERAVRAACDIHDAMVALSAEFGRPLATHIGIANGEVVAASIGSAVRADYTVTGDAVNLASRLEELAGTGETIVSDDVRSALGSRLICDSRGSVAVRGFARELPVWCVRALRAPAAERHALVGRTRERALFDAVLASMHDHGKGATLLLRGDAGVGKTRLAESMLAKATQGNCVCHRAAIVDFGAAQGREATNLLVRSLLELAATAGPDECRVSLDAALAAGRAPPDHEPFLADLLAIAQPAGSPFDAMDHATRALGRIKSIVALAVLSARERPLMFLVEDLHWASPAVVDALAALRERTRDHPIVLTLTSRRDGDPVSAAWPADSVVRIELEPLSTAEALDLARAFHDARPEVAQRCIERAQGNPLFLTQLLENSAGGEALPGTIASVVLARLDRLPAHEKAALQAASIAGQRFDVALVDDLLDGPAILDEARARDLVRDSSSGGLMFSHALIRDAAYASLLHSARRVLHRRAAQWYQQRDLALRAEHLERAEDEDAPLAFLDAARAAFAELHPEVALTLARRGAKLARPGAVAYALEMLTGEVARDLGDAGTSAAAFARAVELAPGDAERGLAHIGVASAHRLTSSIDQGLAALDAAQPIVRRLGLMRELARIAYLRGSLHFARGELGACAAEHERALAHARQAGDEACEAQALSGLADVLYANGRMASAHEAFSGCIALADRRGDVRFTLMNRNMMALVDFYLGEIPRALATIDRALRASREIGHRVAEVMADECAGLVLVGAGRDDEAVAPIERSLALAREIASRRFAAIDLALLGIIARRAGDLDKARLRFDESWALLEEIGPGFAGPLMLASRARIAESDQERRDLLAQGESLLRAGSISHNHFWFREAAIDGSLDAGDIDGAERHADELERYTGLEPSPWSKFVVARARALAAARRGRPDLEALRALRDRAVRLGLRAALPQIEGALAAGVTR